jgi:Papain-like cysteine protease AvrRpt2
MLKSYLEKVKEYVGIIPQYDSNSCQSACCAAVTGNTNVRQVRRELEIIANRVSSMAGATEVMSEWLKKRLGDRYVFEANASLNDCKKWLENGEVLITHGVWTGSGHVTVLKGFELDEKILSYNFITGDPWGEFDAKNWSYLTYANHYEGPISARAVFAACVYAQNRSEAAQCYRDGRLDSNLGEMWVHRIKP